ncbi:double-strand break repair helicase AddA, partial [Rickettsiales bacterium]|nr:double-strand break repair helicase AddA [Rickettsiales bacterium]
IDYNNISKKLIEESSNLQKTASNPNNSCFVLASAGSGKTKILTDRVLRILLSGVNASKILCLTFTKIAALEMKERIFSELSSWCVMSDLQLQDKLQKLTDQKFNNQKLQEVRVIFVKILDDIESLKIETIHSFCNNLIKKFPIEAKIQPNFSIIDDSLSRRLLEESKSQLLEKAVIDNNLGQKISQIARNSGDLGLFEIISDLISKRDIFFHLKNSFVTIEELQKRIFEIIGAKFGQKEDDLLQNFLDFKDNDQKLLDLCQKLQDFPQKTNQKSLEYIKKYLLNKNYYNFLEYKNLLFQKDSLDPKVITRIITKKFLERYPDFEEILIFEQNRIIDFLEAFNSSKIANQTSNIIFIANEILEIYENLKSQNGYLDYQDLIIKTNNLLQDNENANWVRYKLDNLYDHILVDESQDTNHLQWYIISLISEDFFNGDEQKNRTLFAVGDEKQSIYGFQGAEPNIFSDIFGYYQGKFNNIGQKLQKITLGNSFRSTNAILEGVDLVFQDEFYANKISKLSKVKHRAIRSDAGRIEVWPVLTSKKSGEKLAWDLDFDSKKDSAKNILAQKIAKEIKNWIINKKVIIDKKGQKRLLQYKDIMILLKNRTNDIGNLIRKYLLEHNVPVARPDKMSLTNNLLICDFISLFKFILLEKDDLNLACLLKSCFIKITEDELFDLCKIKNTQKIHLITALKQENQLIYQLLQELKQKFYQNQDDISSFIVKLTNDQNILNNIKKEFGIIALDLINQFILFTNKYQDREGTSLQEFIQQISQSNFNIKLENGNIFNEVQIMTIHGAKGLEAPIIFLPDCAHTTNSIYGTGPRENIIWHDNKIPIAKFSKKDQNQFLKEILQQKSEKTYDEYLRLLYVAMTRAENELYICGFNDQKISEDCWHSLIIKAIEIRSKKEEFIDEELDLNDEKLIFSDQFSEDLSNFSPKEDKTAQIEVNLPEFLTKNAQNPTEEEVIYPSKIYDNFDNFKDNLDKKHYKSANIGKITHKILEFLPNLTQNSSESIKIAQKYLKNQNIDAKNQEIILKNIKNIVQNDDFQFIFNKNTKSEVAISAKIDGKIVSGQIDLLIFDEDKIIIIDYKTNINKNISLYREQLNLYRKIIAKIYPDKNILTAIIWTYYGQIEYDATFTH